MDPKTAILAAAVPLGIIAVWFFVMRTAHQQGEARLLAWARREKLTVVSSERVPCAPNLFGASTDSLIPVFRVTVRDAAGAVRKGHVRCIGTDPETGGLVASREGVTVQWADGVREHSPRR